MAKIVQVKTKKPVGAAVAGVINMDSILKADTNTSASWVDDLLKHPLIQKAATLLITKMAEGNIGKKRGPQNAQEALTMIEGQKGVF